MSNWNKIGKPIVVLCLICVVITGALAATNSATAPVIKAAEEAAAQAARTELLPEATASPWWRASSRASPRSTPPTTVWAPSSPAATRDTAPLWWSWWPSTPTGTIKQVKIQSQGETAGVGTKIENESFWSQYTGLPAETITLDQQVDRITGASISSSAVNDAVNFAIAAYNAIS